MSDRFDNNEWRNNSKKGWFVAKCFVELQWPNYFVQCKSGDSVLVETLLVYYSTLDYGKK